MALPDGRELAWLELGDPSGRPVVGFHGTPGSRLQLVVDDEPVRAAGVRLVSVDRPGYGHSSYQPRRTLAGWADDVGQLIDHLGIDRCGVVGISGGGPHALVCAARMPDRVAVTAVLSGVGALLAAGSEEGMMPANVLISRVGRRTTKPLEVLFAAMAKAQKRWPDRALAVMAKQMPPADAAILARPDVRRVFLADLRAASATSAKAAAQDFQIFARDWGFRLEEISVPVHFWQGDADRNVPVAHARQMASAVPDATLHEVVGGGHLVSLDLTAEIFSTLAGYL